MSRKPKGSIPGISLFPFMSILACLIGSLVMIIVGFTIVQISASINLPVLKENQALAQKMLLYEEEIGKLKQRVKGIVTDPSIGNRLHVANANLEAAQKKRQELIEAINTLDFQKRRAENKTAKTKVRLNKRLQQLQKELHGFQAKNRSLRAQNTQSKLMLTRPTGTGESYSASFLECQGDKVILQPNRQKIFSRQHLETLRFISHIRQVQQENRVVIFLIREDGVATFKAARQIAQQYCKKIGFLPLPGDRPIDFSRVMGE